GEELSGSGGADIPVCPEGKNSYPEENTNERTPTENHAPQATALGPRRQRLLHDFPAAERALVLGRNPTGPRPHLCRPRAVLSPGRNSCDAGSRPPPAPTDGRYEPRADHERDQRSFVQASE